MADAFPIAPPRFRAFDVNGDPLAGGKLYAYAAGTTTPQDTFTTRAANVANANPVVLDANGEADVWLTPAIEYKFVLKDSAGVTLWTVDRYPSTQGIALLPDGSVTAPAIAFADDINTGIYSPADGQLGIAADGALAALFTATQTQVRDGTLAAPGLALQSETGTGFYKIGPSQFGLAVAGVLVATFDTNAAAALMSLLATNGQTGQRIDTTGTGIGALLSASGGTGLALGLTGNGTRAPLHIDSGSEPSTKTSGDIYYGSKLKLANGSAWLPIGVGTASVQATPIGNVGAGEDDLCSDTISANTLQTGALARINASGTTANNAAVKTLNFYLGSTVRLTCVLTTSIAADWYAQILIYRTGLNTQRYVCRIDEVNQATLAVRSYFSQGTASETETADIAVKFTGTATSNNDVVQNAMALELP